MWLLQDPSLKRMMGSCITPVWCLGLMDSWFLNTGRYLCSSHVFHTLPDLVFQLNLRLCPHLSRFTSLTLTFQGKSASRSLRHWVQATVCQCLKLVSEISWSVSFTPSWTSLILTFWLLPQPSVKWAWAFATTYGLQSLRSSTAGRVSGWWGRHQLFGLGQVMRLFLHSPGCQLLVYPGAFNMTTGPAHWELLQRGRSDWDTLKHSAPGKTFITVSLCGYILYIIQHPQDRGTLGLHHVIWFKWPGDIFVSSLQQKLNVWVFDPIW